MSDANRVNLVLGKETSFAQESDGSPPTNVTTLRVTGESLMAVTGTAGSQELRSDRQKAFVARTGLSVSGDINCELSAKSFELPMQASLQAASWNASKAVLCPTTIISATVFDIPEDSWVDLGSPTLGDWLSMPEALISSVVTPRFAKVVSAAASPTSGWKRITIKGDDISSVDDALPVLIVRGGAMVNGTTFSTYRIQREYQDLSLPEEVVAYIGCAFDKMKVTVPVDAIVGLSFSVVGKKEVEWDLVMTDSDGADSTDPLTAVDNVRRIFEGSLTTLAASDYTEVSFEVSNNLRSRQVIGTLGAISIGSGTFTVTGTLKKYFGNAADVSSYLGFSDRSLAIVCTDSVGNGCIFDFPRIKYSSGGRPAPGINTDTMADLGFSAFRDPTEGITLRVAKFQSFEGAPRFVSADFDTDTLTIIFDRALESGLPIDPAFLLVYDSSSNLWTAATPIVSLSVDKKTITIEGFSNDGPSGQPYTEGFVYLSHSSPTGGIWSDDLVEIISGFYPATGL